MKTKPDTAVTTCDNCDAYHIDYSILCPKHAATDDLLQALRTARAGCGSAIQLLINDPDIWQRVAPAALADAEEGYKAANLAIARATGEAQ